MHDIFFFLHIPRTAGTTLNAILRNNFKADEIISVYDKQDYEAHAAHSGEDLANIRLIQGHLLLQRYDPPLMYGRRVNVFTFMRDPVARLASEYAFLRSWKANHLYAYLNDNDVTFARYIQSTEKALLYRGKNFMTRSISGLDTENRNYPVKALSRAKKNLEKVFGFVGIQERFPESLILLGQYLGLTNLLYEKRNVLAEEARPQLTSEENDIAEEYNRGDRELYSFACDLFADRVQAAGAALQEKTASLEFMNQKYQKIAGLLMQQSHMREKGPVIRPKDGIWR